MCHTFKTNAQQKQKNNNKELQFQLVDKKCIWESFETFTIFNKYVFTSTQNESYDSSIVLPMSILY